MCERATKDPKREQESRNCEHPAKRAVEVGLWARVHGSTGDGRERCLPWDAQGWVALILSQREMRTMGDHRSTSGSSRDVRVAEDVRDPHESSDLRGS